MRTASASKTPAGVGKRERKEQKVQFLEDASPASVSNISGGGGREKKVQYSFLWFSITAVGVIKKSAVGFLEDNFCLQDIYRGEKNQKYSTPSTHVKNRLNVQSYRIKMKPVS